MTREQAIATWDKWSVQDHPIDAFVALGMLNLDEPKSIEERFNHAVNSELFSSRENNAGNIRSALAAAGLKIVEK